MNKDLELLQPYPFEKLKQLFSDANPPSELAHIPLSIGEPKHKSPAFVLQTITDNLDKISAYPTTKGLPELRQAIATWVERRFNLNENNICAENQVLPVNGTREALFAFAQTVVNRSDVGSDKKPPIVISPNPFYQIYEGAAFLSGAQPMFLPCLEGNNFIPDYNAVSEETWQRCQLVYLCSPGNPTGSITSSETLKQLIELSDKYDFIIASDECYSEIYQDEANPPVGLLEACQQLGRSDFKNCVIFHSLSKRSNLPGLRSGFVAGDAEVLKRYLQYRTYHGCAMPVQHQLASIAAWSDEKHVQENRNLYREKFAAVTRILNDVIPVSAPDASFYLWVKTPICDEQFSRELFDQQHVTVLPGKYLAREVDGINPGDHRVRMALVAPLENCIEAANRIKAFVSTLSQKPS
ncbi:succinyldiaminopimelate transaminase [Gammaproteobacteria bacterium 42_54_T18]|nr:succinyldiaminopimelate transaminase [Gammaproteobacteria bacterium 42_54_T18]